MDLGNSKQRVGIEGREMNFRLHLARIMKNYPFNIHSPSRKFDIFSLSSCSIYNESCFKCTLQSRTSLQNPLLFI